ncbi:hypothetical protein BDV98DRAFT_575583 [Pterulicium gracile]|uniref:Uncharacterized protein n=1 Tax=Pterulicium gracile TaxID=1884261 RepID=A0A5C3Q9A3_9AGAR|nr:hypothetical protein BDV98DRAFT_575583 [Pterula gracilis]
MGDVDSTHVFLSEVGSDDKAPQSGMEIRLDNIDNRSLYRRIYAPFIHIDSRAFEFQARRFEKVVYVRLSWMTGLHRDVDWGLGWLGIGFGSWTGIGLGIV